MEIKDTSDELDAVELEVNIEGQERDDGEAGDSDRKTSITNRKGAKILCSMSTTLPH